MTAQGHPRRLVPFSTMATVIVLGAGASVCEAQTHHPKREKDRPPLDADFFERAKRFNREPHIIERLDEHASRIGYPSPFVSQTTLEQFLKTRRVPGAR